MARLLNSGWLLPVFCVLAVLFGGSSSGGAIANGMLQIVSAALIAVAAMGRDDGRTSPVLPPAVARPFRWLLITVVLIILVPLVPLPPAIWTMMPGREIVSDSLDFMGSTPGWRPIAIEPSRHIASALAFLPVFAALLLALRAPMQEYQRTFRALIGVTIFSGLIGAMQLAAGPSSFFYPYTLSSRGLAIGLFANINHFATLLLVATVLCFGALRPGTRDERGSFGLRTTVWGGLALALLVMLFLNRSLAGIGLGIGVIAYAVMIAIWMKGWRLRAWIPALAVLALVAGILGISMMEDSPQNSLFAQAIDPGLRALIWDNTLAATNETFPFGIGLGNFRWYYTGYQDVAVAIRNYVNHAHNDWLEFILEAGILGVLACILFCWSLIASVRAMPRSERAAPVIWAPWIALALILAHSLVDYPLRTSAMAVVAVILFCAMLRHIPVVGRAALGRSGKRRR